MHKDDRVHLIWCGHVDAIEEAVLPGGRRRRRSYSAQFKDGVVQACQGSGVSIASVALANGMNANLLRRWVNDRERTEVLQRVDLPGVFSAGSYLRAAPRLVDVACC